MIKGIHRVMKPRHGVGSQAFASSFFFRIDTRDDDNVLEVAIIWRVPLLDPARRKATISSLWWARIITLALRWTLMRVAHVDEGVLMKRGLREEKKEKLGG